MAKHDDKELRDEIAFLTNLIKNHKSQQAATVKKVIPSQDVHFKQTNMNNSNQAPKWRNMRPTSNTGVGQTHTRSANTSVTSSMKSMKYGNLHDHKTKFKWTAPVIPVEAPQFSSTTVPLKTSSQADKYDIYKAVNKSQSSTLLPRAESMKPEATHFKLDHTKKRTLSPDKKLRVLNNQKVDPFPNAQLEKISNSSVHPVKSASNHDSKTSQSSFAKPQTFQDFTSASKPKSHSSFSYRTKHSVRKTPPLNQGTTPANVGQIRHSSDETSLLDHGKQNLLTNAANIVANKTKVQVLSSPVMTSTPANSECNTPVHVSPRTRPHQQKAAVPRKNKYKYVRQLVSPIISESPAVSNHNSLTTSSKIKSKYVIRQSNVAKEKAKPIASNTRFKLIRKANQVSKTSQEKHPYPRSSYKPRDPFKFKSGGYLINSKKRRSCESWQGKNHMLPTVYTYTQRSRFTLVKKAVRLSRKRQKHPKASHPSTRRSPNKTWHRDTAENAKFATSKSPARKLFNTSRSRFRFRKGHPPHSQVSTRQWRAKHSIPAVSRLKIDHRVRRGSSSSISSHNTLQRVAHQVLQKSIHTAVIRSRKRRAKCRQYCVFFSRFGRCHHGNSCPNIHDPKRIAICRRFLQGRCRVDSCLFSHHVAKEKVPVCQFFLKGACGRDDCPYLHVNVSKDAGVCAAFLNDGYCPLADKCCKKHVVPDCEEFTKNGSCKKGRQCKLRHNRNDGKKRLISRAQKSAAVKREYCPAAEADEEDDDRHLPLKLRKLPSYITLSSTPPTHTEPPTTPPQDPPLKQSSNSDGAALLIKPRLSF